MTKTVFTIGHSTHPMKEFIDILKAYKISELIDVRRFPGSAYNPQFNQYILKRTLKKNEIKYLWLGQELGGYRAKKELAKVKNKQGACWRSSWFRNYAIYMQTKGFQNGFKKLLKEVKGGNAAIMCAELLYWNCHRMLLSDKLKSLGYKVIHIQNQKRKSLHKYSECAVIRGKKLSYK
ncbi:MAG: DUF488 domain-containing protein [Patescibacteria group bacterium]|nr:DUF488 domain-containing protein [Patescibacteria group bacterium]